MTGYLSKAFSHVRRMQNALSHYRELAALIRDLATNPTMREMFDQQHQHLTRLTDEVEQAMKTQDGVRVPIPALGPFA